MSSRVSELETLLACNILPSTKIGGSLEKYKATIGNQTVMLRIYDNDYYGNRFLREGLVLRNLATKGIVLKDGTKIIVPKIIKEWPEYNIRAIEWFKLFETSVDINYVRQIWSVLNKLALPKGPFVLQDDLRSHLSSVDTMHRAYREKYFQYASKILDEVEWHQGQQGLIHGDYHVENVAFIDTTSNERHILLFDWEFASYGSRVYDILYTSTLNNFKFPEYSSTQYDNWRALITAVLSHWYLQERNFSPKLAIHWYENLAKAVETL